MPKEGSGLATSDDAMKPPKDDPALLRRARKGQSDAWDDLYARYRPFVLGIVRRFIPPNDTEDVMQDCFLHLHKKLHKFRKRSLFSTWFYRMTINICLMWLRKHNKMPTFSIDALTPDAPTFVKHDGELEGTVARVTVQRAIDELPAGMKAHIQFHHIDGLEYKEVSKVLGCSLGNSKSQSNKGRAKLRKALR